MDSNVKPWTEEEDAVLAAYVACEGECSWHCVGKKMGIDRNEFSYLERWTTYLKPKLTSPPKPRPRHDVKGTENKEVKSHNLHSTAYPTQNVGVLPRHNILTGIANKRRMINILSTRIANERSMYSSGVPIYDNKEVKSQNLHSVFHSTTTPTPTPIPASSQNVGVLPMHNILTGIANKRRMYNILTGITNKVPIEHNKRFKAAEATTYNPPKMFLKPGTELTLNSFSAAIETQRSTAVLSGDVLNSNSKELPSVQSNATLPERINIPTAIGAHQSVSMQSGNVLKLHTKELCSNATLPRRIRSQRLHNAKGIELIPTSSPTTSNANQSKLCKEHVGYIAHAPSDAKHAMSDGGIIENGCLIISQGTDYPMEEVFGQIEKRVKSDSTEGLLGKIEEQEMSESKLAPIDVKEQLEGRLDHLIHELEMLVQNSGTVLVQSNISAPAGTQRPEVMRCDNGSTSISKELQSLAKNSTFPERVGLSKVQGAMDVQLLPTSSLNTSYVNLGTGCCSAFKEHEGSIALDAKHAASDGGMTEGSRSIIPQGTDHLMESQPGQTEKLERCEKLGGECGMLVHYSDGDEIYDESCYFSNEEDAEIFCLLRGFLQSAPSPLSSP